MKESFEEILAVGGKSNSLGRTDEVINIVLKDKKQLEELYRCVFSSDAWIRMRAIDAIEKICRQHPDWIKPYIDRFQAELGASGQASIQWHLVQMYSQVGLTIEQKNNVIIWLKNLLSSTEVDWIVAANSMQTLVQFAKDGSVSTEDVSKLIEVQQKHKSKSVVKKANGFLLEVSK